MKEASPREELKVLANVFRVTNHKQLELYCTKSMKKLEAGNEEEDEACNESILRENFE